MWFFFTMFICNLLMPLIMIIGGYLMYKNPPKEINSVIGYRTHRSMLTKDTWAFAHDYCGRLWFKLGIPLLIVSVAVQIPFALSGENTIGIVTGIIEAIQLTILLVSIVPVENALKRNFDDRGNRKDAAVS